MKFMVPIMQEKMKKRIFEFPIFKPPPFYIIKISLINQAK